METRTGAGASTAPSGEAERACHAVLLAMAGRLPDRLLWRLRDWLASGAHVALRTALPRALLRHRVGITEDERARLRTAVLAWGGPARLVDAVLHVEEPPEPSVTFAGAGGPGWDDTDLVLRALAPVTGGVTAVRRAWRSAAGAPVRVVLVATDGTGGEAALAGAVQRALRARGEPDPCVEVLGPSATPTPYHRAALATAEVLWRDGAGRVPSPTRAGLRTPTGALVGHG